MRVLDALGHALGLAGSMTWQITWSLILGFTLSAVVQAVVRRSTVVRLLGSDRPAALARATGLGAASSSCSYAAVALARSLFRKGASFTAAMVFEIASTNLVIEPARPSAWPSASSTRITPPPARRWSAAGAGSVRAAGAGSRR